MGVAYAEWVAILVTVISGLVAFAVGYGKLTARMDQVERKASQAPIVDAMGYGQLTERINQMEIQRQDRMAVVDDNFTRLSHNDELHFLHAKEDQDHFNNRDIHTTAREKDAIEKGFEGIRVSMQNLTNAVMESLKK